MISAHSHWHRRSHRRKKLISTIFRFFLVSGCKRVVVRHFVPEFSTFYCDKRTGSYGDLYGVLWTRGGEDPLSCLCTGRRRRRGGGATEIFKTKNSDGRAHGSANTIMSNRWICEQHVFPLKCTALLILCNLLSTLNENESALSGEEKHYRISFL